MTIIDQLLDHDSWTTDQLLIICADLSDGDLDREYDIGHRTIRQTLAHVIRNMEIWSSLMAGESVSRETDDTIGREVPLLPGRIFCTVVGR